MYQYAGLEVALSFPSWVDLGQIVPRDFRRSEARMRMEEGLVRFLSNGGDANEFNVQGINFSWLGSPFQPIFWICTTLPRSKKRAIGHPSKSTTSQIILLEQDLLVELNWRS